MREQNELKNDVRKQLIIIVSSIILTVIITLGSSFASFVWSNSSEKNQKIVIGDFSLEIDDSSPSLGGTINLSNAYPIEYIDGESYTCKDENENNIQVTTEDDYIKYCVDSDPYIFKITNNGSVPNNYILKLISDEVAVIADNCSENLMDKSNIKINVDGDLVIGATLISDLTDEILDTGILYPGESKTYKLNAWIKNDVSNDIESKHFHAKLQLEYHQNDLTVESLSGMILGENNSNVSNLNPTFTKESNDKGLYKNINNNGTTYYYRGNVDNNYVSFGNITWKIVRINEDGTIRLITNESILNGSYNNVETLLNEWYSANISNNTYLDSQVVSTNFCNDTSYTSANRFGATNSPLFTCSVDFINKKVSTITADEIVFAGSIYESNNNVKKDTYLNNNTNFLTLTLLDNSNVYTFDGNNTIETEQGIRPVINLKSDITASGTGHLTDPYIIQ